VVGYWDGSIRLWCRQSEACLSNNLVPVHQGQVSKVHLDSPVDEGSCLVRQHLFTAGRDCKVRRIALRVAKTKEGVSIVRDPVIEEFVLDMGSPITAMAVGPDHILCGATNAKLKLWDKRCHEKVKTLERHKNSVRAVCLRHPLALSGSRDKTALLWDLNTGSAVR